MSLAFSSSARASQTRADLLPSFSSDFSLLSSLSNNTLVDGHAEIGQAWLLSSKIARKAGHVQTAYSAVLQAGQSSTPFAFVQGAKLLASGGQALRALQELQHSLDPLLEVGLRAKVESSSSKGPSRLAKVRSSLPLFPRLSARSNFLPRLLFDPGCSPQSSMVPRRRSIRQQRRYRRFRSSHRSREGVSRLRFFAPLLPKRQLLILLFSCPRSRWESAYYHLGHFYDRDAAER